MWKNNFNRLCDYLYIFILKSIHLLKDDGELIFITPEYWFKNLHSRNLRNLIISECYIKEIYYLNEVDVFKNVKSSFIIFKIIKKKIKPKIKVFKIKKNFNKIEVIENIFLNIDKYFDFFEIDQYELNKKWLLFKKDLIHACDQLENSCINFDKDKELFSSNESNTLEKISSIANGLVSGFDKAFICNDDLNSKLNNQEKKYLVSIVKSKHLIKYKFINYQKYILLNDANVKNFKKEFPNYYYHFKQFKFKLLNRYDYKNGINYWDWSFLRSYKLQKSNKKKICIPCKLRIKSYEDINFSLVDEKYLLTQDVTSIFVNKETKEDIKYILGFLNCSVVKKWIFINNNNRGNVLEFSEEPLKNIPLRLIDWKNKSEIKIYDKIIYYVDKNLDEYDVKNSKAIDLLVNDLLNIKMD